MTYTLSHPGQKLSIDLTPKSKIQLALGSNSNTLNLAYFSPWKNFPDKIKELTQRPYLYDPKRYQPGRANSRARRIVTEHETLIIGSLRFHLYFGIKKHSTFLEPEHLKLDLHHRQLSLTHLAKHNWTRIQFRWTL